MGFDCKPLDRELLVNRGWDVATSTLASAARLGHSWQVRGDVGARPAAMLTLYEFEACPWCRRVREALTVLDLDVLVKPCPKGGERFRPEAVALGGKTQFPLLVDGAVVLYESLDIVRHLHARYGAGNPSWQLYGPQFGASSGLASVARSGRGLRARPSRPPSLPVELWSYDISPYCRLVREVLCELELPYLLRNISRGSTKREAFLGARGRLQFPYFSDPNTGAALFESADIVAYLEQTYAV